MAAFFHFRFLSYTPASSSSTPKTRVTTPSHLVTVSSALRLGDRVHSTALTFHPLLASYFRDNCQPHILPKINTFSYGRALQIFETFHESFLTAQTSWLNFFGGKGSEDHKNEKLQKATSPRHPFHGRLCTNILLTLNILLQSETREVLSVMSLLKRIRFDSHLLCAFATSIGPYLNEKVMFWLKDGRVFIGTLYSLDRFGNVALEGAIERVIVGELYCDIGVGMYLFRCDSLILVGVLRDQIDEELPAEMIRVTEQEIRRAQTDQRNRERHRMRTGMATDAFEHDERLKQHRVDIPPRL